MIVLLAALSISQINIQLNLDRAAKEEGVSSKLLKAICYVESHFNPTAIRFDKEPSIGLCQLQYPTALSVGHKGNEVDLWDSYINAKMAARYLKLQLNRYDQNLVLAIAAYNSGTARFDINGNLINRDYVHKVLNKLFQEQ